MTDRSPSQPTARPAVCSRASRGLATCLLSLLCLAPAAGFAQSNDAALLRSYIDAKQPIPPGEYVVGRTSSFVAIPLHAGDQVLGYGVTIVLQAGANAHVFNAQDATDVVIVGVTIDGNSAQQTAGVHGIRLANVSGVTIRDVTIRNTHGYGIGCQGGLCANLFFDHLVFEDTGLDSIDIKNFTNADTGVMISNIRITNPGTQAAAQAGIDIRGPAIVTNVFVTELGAGQSGIRLRDDGTGGIGGHGSVIEAFHVHGNAQAIGVKIERGVSNYRVGLGVCRGITTCVVGSSAATTTRRDR